MLKGVFAKRKKGRKRNDGLGKAARGCRQVCWREDRKQRTLCVHLTGCTSSGDGSRSPCGDRNSPSTTATFCHSSVVCNGSSSSNSNGNSIINNNTDNNNNNNNTTTSTNTNYKCFTTGTCKTAVTTRSDSNSNKQRTRERRGRRV